MEKRYSVQLEHWNDAAEIKFECERLEDALRYIANNIEGVEYPSERDNVTSNLYCYRLYDSCKLEDDGDGVMIPSEILYTDYFYND
jgi:hypothetical protein